MKSIFNENHFLTSDEVETPEKGAKMKAFNIKLALKKEIKPFKIIKKKNLHQAFHQNIKNHLFSLKSFYDK